MISDISLMCETITSPIWANNLAQIWMKAFHVKNFDTVCIAYETRCK